MKGDKRLDVIENGLSPKQAVIRWIKEAHCFSTPEEYVKANLGKPEWPGEQMTDQVSAPVRQAMKGQSEKSINIAVRNAQRDVIFLIQLHHQVNFYFLNEDRIWSLGYVYLEAELRAIHWLGFVKELDKMGRSRSQRVRRDPKAASRLSAHDNAFWRDQTLKLLPLLYRFRQASKTICQLYFDGEEILFPDLASGLSDLIEKFETLVSNFNNLLPEKSDLRLKIASLVQRAQKESAERVSYLVDMAKAETLDAIGDKKGAAAMALRHIEECCYFYDLS